MLAASPCLATVHGEESGWLRLQIAKRTAKLALYVIILTAGATITAAYDVRLAFGVLLAGIMFIRGRAVTRRLQQARKGAAGELETAKMLALLPASFTVLNDFAFSGFNVDHVVVGPTGVWAIETKSHLGRIEEHADGVWLNDRPMYRDPRRQARGGAAAIAELLERDTGRRYWVDALVCFPNATVAANGYQGEECVVGGGQLLTRLRLKPTQLGSEERARLVAVLSARKQQRSLSSSES